MHYTPIQINTLIFRNKLLFELLPFSSVTISSVKLTVKLKSIYCTSAPSTNRYPLDFYMF